ncbi:hypothetical protein [Actinacidiphila glaucinigra]|uniref:hypothetical protein n=1 Tax=Actinacidiphila glaucinigra TaxID=235986 RepID=UPI0036E43E9F
MDGHPPPGSKDHRMLDLAAHAPVTLFVVAVLPHLRVLALLGGLLAALRGTTGRTRTVLFTAFTQALSPTRRRP